MSASSRSGGSTSLPHRKAGCLAEVNDETTTQEKDERVLIREKDEENEGDDAENEYQELDGDANKDKDDDDLELLQPRVEGAISPSRPF